MEIQSLWPDFYKEDIRGPKSILLEQATYLTEETNSILSAEIITNRYKGRFTHTLSVVAPLLDNYKYALVSVEHEVLYYPATISWEVSSEDKRLGAIVENPDELIERLRVIFNHPDTIKIVSSLLSQSIAERRQMPL